MSRLGEDESEKASSSTSRSPRLKRLQLAEKATVTAIPPESIQLNPASNSDKDSSLKTNRNEHIDGESSQLLLSPINAATDNHHLPSLQFTPASPIIQHQEQENQDQIRENSQQVKQQQQQQQSESRSPISNPIDTSTTSAASSSDHSTIQQSRPSNKLNLNLFRRKSNKNKLNSQSDDAAPSSQSTPPPPIPDPSLNLSNHNPILSPSTLTPAPIHNSLVPNLDLQDRVHGSGAATKSKGKKKGDSKGKGKADLALHDGNHDKSLPDRPDESSEHVSENREENTEEEDRQTQSSKDLGLAQNHLQDSNDNQPGHSVQNQIEDDTNSKTRGKERRLNTASSTSSSSFTSNLHRPRETSSISSNPDPTQSTISHQSSSSNLAPPPLGLNSTLNSSESWLNPQDSEGQFIRKTYKHFESKGVKDDGFVEGTEFTRIKNNKAAWEIEDEQEDGDETLRNDRVEDITLTEPSWSNQQRVIDSTTMENKEEVLKTPTSPFGFLLSRKRTNSSRPTTPMGPPVSSEDFKRMLDRSNQTNSVNGEENHEKVLKKWKSRDAAGGGSGGSIFRNKSGKSKGKEKDKEKGTKDKSKGKQKEENNDDEEEEKKKQMNLLEIDSVLANGITHHQENQLPTSTTVPTPTSISSFSPSTNRNELHTNSTSVDDENENGDGDGDGNLETELERERKNGIISQNSFLLPINGPRSTNSHSSGLSNLTEVHVTLQDRIKQKEEAERKREEFLGNVDR